MHRTNSKLPPLQDDQDRLKHFTLSIKSKKQPFFSHQKSLIDDFSQTIYQEPEQQKFFPVEEYKNFLKGQKIYLELYYKDKIFVSGYEPYIEAMGGEVMKRITPSTTVVLTNQMSREKYIKLKARVEKTCKPDILILSILWIEEIYRQKRKVQKDPFIFDEQTDLINSKENQSSEEEDPMPDYFEREVFKQDFQQTFQKYMQLPNNEFFIRIQENKKMKEKDILTPSRIAWIEPMKFSVLDDQDDYKYKDLKNNKNYKFFNTSNKKDKKKNPKNPSEGIKKPVIQKEKKRRSTVRRSEKFEIEKIQKRQISTEFQDQNREKQQKRLQMTQNTDKQSDSEFLQRLKIKKQNSTEESINTILNKYLNKNSKQNESNSPSRYEEKYLPEIQEMVSAQNYVSNPPWNDQDFENGSKEIYLGDLDSQNFDRGNSQHQAISSQNIRNRSQRRLSLSRSKQRNSFIMTQQKPKQSKVSSNNNGCQLFQKTKTVVKPWEKSRQDKIIELQNKFKQSINQFIQIIGYQKDSDGNMNSESYFPINQSQKIVYNTVIKEQHIISRVEDFNKAVKQKLNPQTSVYFNIISFQKWNKTLSRFPVAKFLFNFHEMSQSIIEKQQMSNKIQIIKDLFGLKETSEQQVICNYQALCDLMTSQTYNDLNFYYLCNGKVKEEVIMGYLSEIDKKSIIDYNSLKPIFDLLAKKEWKTKESLQNSQSFSLSLSITDRKPTVVTKEFLKKMIEQEIFPNFRIKARITAQIINGKKITCIPINLISNVEFVSKKLKARFISIRDYMSNTEQADIVVNDKRSFSKAKNVWEPDYPTFVSSLIVIE